MPYTIRPFEPRDQGAARQLIEAGLGEHFGWIDESRNPDLNDIASSYVRRGHVFFVAEVDGKLVGTGALLTEDRETGRIVRVSVANAHRREGIGRTLVRRLVLAARRKGIKQIRVETNVGWEDAIGLYRDCGLHEYGRDEIGVHMFLALEDDESASRAHKPRPLRLPP